MEYSKYQLNIFKYIEKQQGNLVVEAVAGSGKTTTIIECTNRIPSNKKILVCAFNKAIEQELNSRFLGKSNVTVKTLHAIGYKAIYNNKGTLGGKIRLDSTLLFNFIKDLCYKTPLSTKSDKWKLTLRINMIIGYIKNTDLREINQQTLQNLCDIYGIDFGWDKQSKIEELNDLLSTTQNMEKRKSINDTIKNIRRNTVFDPYLIISIINKVIDWNKRNFCNFDDMLWIPVQHEFKYDKFDYIFIDEVQDLNKVQMNLLKVIAQEGTRIIGVGDSKQAIYGFRGAILNGMDEFKNHFNAQLYPLSICYRCPKLLVEYVQKIVPSIEPSPTAELGIFQQIDTDNMYSNLKQGDLVLCRINSPLLKLLFLLMNKKIKAYIEGMDIGKKIKEKIDSIDSTSLHEVIATINSELIVIIEQYEREKSLQNFELLFKLDNKRDFLVMVLEVLNNCTEYKDYEHLCDTYFCDNKGDGYIRLSSIHKAKGLESDNVYILHPEKIPHKLAKQDWEVEQESNLKYVAYTRARQKCYEIVDFEE